MPARKVREAQRFLVDLQPFLPHNHIPDGFGTEGICTALTKENLMNVQRLGLAVCCILGLALTARAEDKKDVDAKKLLGTWVCTEGKGIEGATIEFLKDGKGKVTHKDKDGKEVTEDFSYVIDGDTVKVTHKDKDGKDVTMPHKITTLTDKEMVAEHDKGEIAKFKKKLD
jgi:uncharacterized protein (TIGR03066 family)